MATPRARGDPVPVASPGVSGSSGRWRPAQKSPSKTSGTPVSSMMVKRVAEKARLSTPARQWAKAPNPVTGSEEKTYTSVAAMPRR